MTPLILQWLTDYSRAPLFLAAVAILIAGIASYLWRPDKSAIPSLSGTIPRLSITLLYMTNMKSFLARARNALRQRNIVQFYLGPMKVYLIAGTNNIQAMFRTSASVSSDIFFLMVQEHIWGSTKEDLAKFANDKSGRLQNPAPGTEKTPDQERYWAGMHRTIHSYLARTHETNALAGSYQRFFGQQLDRFQVGREAEVCIYDFLLKDMAEAAITSINGRRVLDVNPGLLEILWRFHEIAASLVWGLPKWLNRESWKRRDQLQAACARYLKSALSDFDWSQGADPDWEPIFGSRFTRELVRWMTESGFALTTMAGGLANMTVFGGNANTIPVAAWCVMEVVKDPALLKVVREEVMTAYEIAPASGQKTINAQALLSLPLLQSIYIEGLRLHVSMNVTRQITGPVELGGVTLEKGAILQAATEITHYDEEIWGAQGHPASEFWAERHVKYVNDVGADGQTKRVRQFAMAGKPNDFFPYGGGVSICPGRFFAKQEIMLTIAMLVSRFDIEFVEWVNRDGTPSDRPAQNDSRWSGGASVPPDRDMKVLWKRLW
ncbi:cytochrome P450 [Lasiosphaeria hispida]|uniref:Cytochrome P450 n=1 Tax=Lasiosphaeria hispida TaxID=260671 RepID=A0AAJ0HNN2_9PEZI|nr:cytochrome P450 [Lasiosphaeria hispida]